MKYQTDVFLHGPRLAALARSVLKTSVRYFTSTECYTAHSRNLKPTFLDYDRFLESRNIYNRAATVNLNIGYPWFRTHGSVSVPLFQISVRFRFVFFLNINVVKTEILTGKSYKI